ncbi:MAG TPA: hypothetical protein VFV65_01640, partial [Gemmatimonadales bacterium]|nr:hypothetical protein [Gemmatimonadales bacterium]
MTSAGWLDTLAQRDASLSLALAALVGAADADGSVGLDRLVLGYRSTFLSAVETIPGLPRSELTGDQLRESLTRSVLPRLADGGWVADASAEDWATVRAAPGWWGEAAADRNAAMTRLLAAAQEAHHRREAGLRTPRPTGSVLEG